MKSNLLLSSTILVTGVFPAMGETLLIDDFDTPPGGVTLTDLPGGGSATALTASPAVIGGWRFVELAAAGLAGLSASVDINVVPDRMAISNGPGVSSVTTLSYDANGATLGDIDLLGAGLDSVQFNLDLSDFASTLSVTLYDGATTAEAVIPLPTAPPADLFAIPFADFTVVGGGNPFASLDKIKIVLSAPASADIIIHDFFFSGPGIPTVPESSAVVAIVGLAGVAGATIACRRKSTRS